jgi:hypothetical protein
VRKKMENASLSICHNVQGECREMDTRGFMLKSRNTSDLLRIQEVMNSMEGRAYTRDQVIERIIGFYGKFVPF